MCAMCSSSAHAGRSRDVASLSHFLSVYQVDSVTIVKVSQFAKIMAQRSTKKLFRPEIPCRIAFPFDEGVATRAWTPTSAWLMALMSCLVGSVAENLDSAKTRFAAARHKNSASPTPRPVHVFFIVCTSAVFEAIGWPC